MSCEFCENADFGLYCAQVRSKYFSKVWSKEANILFAGGNSRFPKEEQFEYCPMCGEALTEPEPLTLEELREMDGEPVWCVEENRWGLVLQNDNEYEMPMFRIMFNDGSNLTEYYIKTRAPKGLIYRRPPKGAAPCQT